MIGIFFHGFELGIVLAFLIGPVFFVIIQTSIERGFWRGLLVALGVSISDIIYVIICCYGYARIMASSNFKLYLAYGGGAILIAFGIYHLLVKSRMKPPHPDAVQGKGFKRYLIKGFLINGMTPTVLIFWIGTVSLATVHFGYSKDEEFVLFFAGLLATVLATDILKAYLADKLRRIITAASIKIINIVLGIVLIGFGTRLILLANTFSFV